MPLDFTEIADELHKQVERHYTRRRVIAYGIDEIWGADLVHMPTEIAKINKDYLYILTVIDVFSKYAWVIPLQDKTSATVIQAFNSIIKKSKRKPQFLWVDKGGEFYSKQFIANLKKQHIEMYSTYGEHKSVVIERFNRTIKNWMFKYFTSHNTREWINVVDELTSKYNDKEHRSIGMTPIEASEPKNSKIVFHNLYGNMYNDIINKEQPKPKFKVGDYVRISRIKEQFERGFDANYSREIFKVSAVKRTTPITYKLDEYDGTPIEGSFYAQELQKTNNPDFFEVEKVLKTRTRRGVKEEYVKFLGWGSKYNLWVPVSNIEEFD